jgi:hypothetical protein
LTGCLAVGTVVNIGPHLHAIYASPQMLPLDRAHGRNDVDRQALRPQPGGAWMFPTRIALQDLLRTHGRLSIRRSGHRMVNKQNANRKMVLTNMV